jgi:hypothetical protein
MANRQKPEMAASPAGEVWGALNYRHGPLPTRLERSAFGDPDTGIYVHISACAGLLVHQLSLLSVVIK